ncbi:MAG: gamma-glutamyltransferase [Bacteroidetes bacterium]|nr:MAG: gamma-glutamyltransferase [Bacteroidota bacterium]
MKRIISFYLLLFLLFTFSCRQATVKPVYETQKSAFADSAMVVSPHPLATRVGVEIMKQGGNAIDATAGVHFALAVVYPRAGNIGGGGFMVIRTKDGTAAALDYREKAPLAADRDMYLDEKGDPIDSLSRKGHLAVGVPGTVAGMLKSWERFGRLKDFKKIIQPAIDLAAKGFKISESEAERLNKYRDEFLEVNENAAPFVRDGDWKAGDLLVQPELAKTLERIRDRGKAGFYEGETADLIVKEMKRGGGIITHEDLKQYDAVWRDPIDDYYKDYRVITMPPSSSGGIALMQLLNIVEDYPISEWGFHSPEAIHLMVEGMRRVYADRAEYLGDMDFYPVPVDSLLDEAYLEKRMENFDPEKATPSDTILAGKFNLPEHYETTHTSIVDPEGNAVSVTTTLNLNYGSKVIVQGAGFLLNDEMDDFSAKPGVPNFFGLIGNEANAIAPGKRMLSSMTPTIVEKDDKLFMVVGTPGGSTIITSVFQTFINVAEFNMDLKEAVHAPRFHHQWLPDEIRYEKNGLDSLTIKALEARGHKLREVGRIGVVKAIHVLPDGRLHGVGDWRNKDDDAEGF